MNFFCEIGNNAGTSVLMDLGGWGNGDIAGPARTSSQHKPRSAREWIGNIFLLDDGECELITGWLYVMERGGEI